ncbi:MAG TPA: sensor histidine kinase [Myxococcales bacterium]|nr:sensor histidine kinase [Myxococcales bacterium]
MANANLERAFGRWTLSVAVVAGFTVVALPPLFFWLGAERPETVLDSRALWAATAATGALGLLVCLVVYAIPRGAARREHRELTAAVAELRQSEAKLQKMNDELSAWMVSAVNKVRDLSERVVQGQEAERERIARDLHDVVGQALAALTLDLELVRKQPAEAASHLKRALGTTQYAIQELRRVVYDMRPPELSAGADVAEVLRNFAERFEVRTGLPTSFRLKGEKIRSEEVATVLLRVLQEALTNISRHARASEVGIALTVDPEKLVMEVTDDGAGFDSRIPRAGAGLRSIEERCALVGGSVEVHSEPMNGTRLKVQLPLTGKAA